MSTIPQPNFRRGPRKPVEKSLPPTAELIWSLMGDGFYADGIPKLSANSGKSERSVYRAIAELTKAGIIEVHDRRNRRAGDATVYRIHRPYSKNSLPDKTASIPAMITCHDDEMAGKEFLEDSEKPQVNPNLPSIPATADSYHRQPSITHHLRSEDISVDGDETSIDQVRLTGIEVENRDSPEGGKGLDTDPMPPDPHSMERIRWASRHPRGGNR